MQQIERLERYLQGHQWMDTEQIGEWRARRAVYEGPSVYTFADGEEFVSQGDWLIDSGTTIFLERTISVPERFAGWPLGLVLEVGGRGEGLISIDGAPYHGLDRNRSYIPLPAGASRDGSLQVTLELFNPAALPEDELNPNQVTLEETAPTPLYLRQSLLVVPNRAAESLLHTVQVYKAAVSLLPDGDRRKHSIAKALKQVADEVLSVEPTQLLDQNWLSQLEASLKGIMQRAVDGFRPGRMYMYMIGQSHIDTAWLWPIKETVRKCSRTFSTACTLLDVYPEFLFSHSQPQQYEFVKQHYPALYERIKKHIAAGRWEIVGGMWVEPDLNIPSGESLVRQLLYGKRFFQKEFGANPRVEWLLDTFGYCASLPQLLKKAGMDYFMTTKMNWNDTNPFPYDLFYWVGIDGTKVLSFLNHGLNEHTKPEDIAEHWASFKQKNAHPEQMLLYGHGDGGGGDRKAEVLYREAEIWSTLAFVHGGAYPQQALSKGWKLILTNQFHDIIPGSSIHAVYEDAEAAYETAFDLGRQSLQNAMQSIAANVHTAGVGTPLLVFNSLGWSRGCDVVLRGGSNGEIIRLFDKENRREVVPQGQVANQFQLFHDRPPYWDAWDIDPNFNAQPAERASLESVDVVLAGQVKDVIRFVWRLGQSTIYHDLVLHHHSRRVDFVTKVDWRASHRLLKVAFPVNVLANHAVYEIPFGTVERSTHLNTTWDRAQFEVCGHRWADLSDGGYGVALLNDCKYGYDVKRNVLRLSLLRAPKWPDPMADQGIHEFTYSLYPHRGTWRDAGVVQQGFELNHPVEMLESMAHAGTLPPQHTFLSFQSDTVVLDTLKRAEDSDDVILRMYESTGSHAQVDIRSHFPVQGAQITDLLEQPEADLELRDNGVSSHLRAYEVQTLKVRVRKGSKLDAAQCADEGRKCAWAWSPVGTV
ncbi:MAG: alpha-mannosidase [Alicyclobacillus sp.]|nr:alpha-mannosidase [Alicyclobacillus sp.]